MLGVGFDISSIMEEILPEIDIINVENPLYTNYLNTPYQMDADAFLSKRYGKIVITDGPYIDLNPAAAEKQIAEIVKQKVLESISFAKQIGSQEIIYLSNFLPMIKLDFYDDTYVQNSIRFWKAILQETDGIRISLCNTFEYTPQILLRIVKGINCSNLGLACDIGHALAYSGIPLQQFYNEMEGFCHTVYLHSNHADHDEHLNIYEGSLLANQGFVSILPKLKHKNVIFKPFDKTNIHKNITTYKHLQRI